MNWRIHTEKKLEDFSDFVFEHSKKTILLVLLAVAGLISHLPTLTMDTSTEGFLHESDPMRIGYDVFRDQFGRDEKVLLAIKTSNIFDAVFLDIYPVMMSIYGSILILLSSIGTALNK